MKNNIMKMVFVFALIVSIGCTRVYPGYEGIKVNLWGESRGVDDVTIVTGRVFYNPVTTDVVEFPIHMQRYLWAWDGETDYSLQFITKDKVPVNVDVEAQLYFKEGRTPQVYVQHRLNPEAIIQGFVRGQIRDGFVRCGSDIDSMAILGGGTVELQDCVSKLLNERLGENYQFDRIIIVNAPRVPDKIMGMINETVEKAQEALREENTVRIKEAQARQLVAEATGQAEAVRLKAIATAEANRIISHSLTAELVEFRKVEKWNGIMPQVTGGGQAFLNISK